MVSLVCKLKKTVGENLVSLVEYYNGDETRLVAICNKLDIDTLKKFKKIKHISIFTEEEIKNAADVFPVELLHMQKHHKLLYGADILGSIYMRKEDIRQQLEFEFRSKLIHLRQAYVSSNGKALDNIILAAVPNLAPIIGALVYLQDISIEYDLGIFTSICGVDISILKEIYEIRKGRFKLRKDRDEYIRQLIDVLEKIGKVVDKIKV